jgi:chromosome segregation ATPase
MQVQIVEYSQTAAALGELRQKYENVVFPVDTTAGMKDAVAARKELRDIRVGLEKMRKELKEPALRRCQLIDSEAKTITASLTALEDPIDTQIKAEERRKEELRREAERREFERVEAIQEKIDGIRRLPFVLIAEPAAEIELEINALREFVPGDEFAEFKDQAAKAKQEVIDRLVEIHAEKIKADNEAARLAAEQEKLRSEREELERMKRDLEQARQEAQRIESVAEKIAEELTAQAKPAIEAVAEQAIQTGTAAMRMSFDGETIVAEQVQVEAPADFVHRTRIERHRNYPEMAVEFALGPANIVLTFDGKTGELKAAEVL